MTSDPVFITAGVASLCVAAVLIFGIASFGRDKAGQKSRSNLIMRWRLGAQFMAIIVVMALLYWQTKG